MFVTVKSAYLIYSTLRASIAWRGHFRVQALLLVSAILVGLIYWYKMTSKEIMPLFFLQGFSMWMATMSLPALLSFVKHNKSSQQARTQAVQVQHALNLGFIFAFAGALFGSGAQCDAESSLVVPWSFYSTFALFMI